MIEYALLVALIALAMLAAFSPMADRVLGKWQIISDNYTAATGD